MSSSRARKRTGPPVRAGYPSRLSWSAPDRAAAAGGSGYVRFRSGARPGTTSSRAILFDRAGAVRASAQQEFPQLYPQPGWVEHDPLAIWGSQLDVAREALARAGASATQLAAIGIANQRETTLLWERASGRPLHNAIVWQDRRTARFCDELKAEGFEAGSSWSARAWVTDPYFSGTKLRWLLENVPGARERAHCGELAFGTVDTWLLWQLTGGRLHVTDLSNASRTMLYDIHGWTGASRFWSASTSRAPCCRA